jgi:hypothetical protein
MLRGVPGPPICRRNQPALPALHKMLLPDTYFLTLIALGLAALIGAVVVLTAFAL